MTRTRKITAVLLSIVMMITAMAALSLNAGAATFGSYDISVTSGKQYTEKLGWGGSYIDCKFVSEASGELTLNVICEEQVTYVYVYDYRGMAVASSEIRSSYGIASSYYNSLTWDSAAEFYSGTLTFRIDKGTYYIRFVRDDYSLGTGNITFTATYPTTANRYCTGLIPPYYCPTSSTGTNLIYYDTSEENRILKYFSIQMPAGVSFKFGIVAASSFTGTVTWGTSNKSAVKVSSKGKITTVAKGRALITAKYGSETLELLIDVVG